MATALADRPEHHDLTRRAYAGDRQAFADIYALTVDRITRYVAVRLRERDRDGIDDVVQDTYYFALAEPTLINDDLVGSLLRLAARACTRHQWAHRRYLRAALTVGEHQPADRPHLPVSGGPIQVTVAHALAGLTPDQRRAIHLRLLDDIPRANAAQLMGRSVAAVRALEQRGLRRLHSHFAAAPRPQHRPSATAASSCATSR